MKEEKRKDEDEKEIVSEKKVHKIFIPVGDDFELGKDMGMVFKFSGLAIKGAPNFYATDVIKDYGEMVRIKFDLGEEQVLWFIHKRELRELKEIIDKISLK
jgi:hypothetical protein